MNMGPKGIYNMVRAVYAVLVGCIVKKYLWPIIKKLLSPVLQKLGIK